MKTSKEKISTSPAGNNAAARLSSMTAILTVSLIVLLHFLKPDQDPAWHMLSEYSIGDWGWVMQLAFFSWCISCASLAFACRYQVQTRGGRIGIVLLWIASLGILMAGIFVIDSPNAPKEAMTMHGQLHGLSTFLGVPFHPIAAVLISKSLVTKFPWRYEKKPIMRLAHLTWITLLLMFATIVLMAITNHGRFGPGSLIGYANRIWVLACCFWLFSMARRSVKFNIKKQEPDPECDLLYEELS
jgi:hypothetical protein